MCLTSIYIYLREELFAIIIKKQPPILFSDLFSRLCVVPIDVMCVWYVEFCIFFFLLIYDEDAITPVDS